jgi:YHS domain-containing protein
MKIKTTSALVVLVTAGTLTFLAGGCTSESGHVHQTGMTSTDSANAMRAALPEGNPHAGYCPVMGGKVDREKADASDALHVDYQGKRYYFCCKGCKPMFEKDPEKWIASPATPQKEEA